MGKVSVEERARVWTPRFLMFFVMATAMDTARFMVNSTIGLVAQDAAVIAGISADRIGSMVGLISSVMGITAFLLMIIVGPATVVFKPNKLLAVGCFGTALSYILLSFYTIPFFILARVIDGICNPFLGAALMMIARDRMSMDKSGASMGIFQMRNSIGKVVGPLIGVNGIAILFSYVINFRVAAAVWVVCAFVALTMKLKNTEFKPQPFRLKPTNIIPKGTLIPFLVVVLFQIGQMALGNFNMVYAKTQLGVQNVGVMMSVGNIAAILLGPFFASLADKIGLKKGIFIGMFIWALGPITFAFIAKDLITVCIAAAFQYVGFAAMAGMLQALLIKQAPPEIAGVVGNAYFGGMNLGSFFGPLLAGFIVDLGGYRTMYLSMLVPLAICAILVQIYSSKIKVTATEKL